jgi:hypothetical protein
LPIIKAVISQVNSVFLQEFTKTYILKILHTKQNKSTVIELFHRKIDYNYLEEKLQHPIYQVIFETFNSSVSNDTNIE